MPKRQDIRTILIIGSGPIVIGQGCEFDYSGAQACKALKEEGLRVDEDLIWMGRPRREMGRTGTRQMLDRSDPPTAFFTANNQLALGAFEEIRERGLSIPEDLALVGFDDAPWAKLLDPPLTTVRQPTYEIGRRAAELLFARIDEPDRPPAFVTLQPELVVRRSCGGSFTPRA